MVLDLTFLSLSIVLFVMFIASIILHRRRLNRVLRTATKEELNKVDNLKQPYLSLANALFVLSLTFYIFVTLGSQIPVEVFVKPITRLFIPEHETYLIESNLITDVLPAVLATLFFSSVYPLVGSQEMIGDWFEFSIGFATGCGIAVFAAPFYYVLMPFLAVLFILGLFSSRQSIFMAGFIYGFLVLFVFVASVHTLEIIFWLFYALVFGILSSVFYASKRKFELLMAILLGLSPTVYLDLTFFLIFLLGAVLFLVYVLEPKCNVKVAMIITFLMVFYLVDGLAHSFVFGLMFVIALGIEQIFIAELHRSALRAIITKWIVLSSKAETGNKVVNLSDHVCIPNFQKKKIKKNSYTFIYLNYLLIRPLEKEGFTIKIIEEKDKWETIIKSIFVRI